MATNDLEMRVDIDVAQAKAELESLKRSVESFVSDIKRQSDIRFNLKLDAEQALKELASFKELAGSFSVDIKVDAAENLESAALAIERMSEAARTGKPHVPRACGDEPFWQNYAKR
jgi:hypothetical protein